jgi:hypothetical protein
LESSYYKFVPTPCELDEIKELFHSLPNEKVKRYYNLFYLNKRDIPKDKWLVPYAQKEKGLRLYAQYFLEYPVGSFTKAHTDNNDCIQKTAITLVETEDLEGGDIIVYEPHYKKDWDVTPDVLNRYTEGDYTPGETIIPVIVNQKVGETVEYAHNVKHSVSKVLKGRRVVLVTWYENVR